MTITISDILEFIGLVSLMFGTALLVLKVIDTINQTESNRQQISLLWSEMRNNNNFTDVRLSNIEKNVFKEDEE